MCSSALSAWISSAGAMRCSSDSSWAGAHSVTWKAPLARLSQARPARGSRLPVTQTAASARSALAGSKASSVRVPGVTMRTMRRSTGPLAAAGSPICSQMATDSPSATRRARYCSMACTGMPAIGIGVPFELPRLVSVRLSRRAARSASS
ncbi:Uncharacterised protein [Bordetella pertussis]|nr:Uncharacterised protein [Bordetella pertussis]CPO76832.1 Uncharacterised protein [Bordetella pertussis]